MFFIQLELFSIRTFFINGYPIANATIIVAFVKATSKVVYKAKLIYSQEI